MARIQLEENIPMRVGELTPAEVAEWDRFEAQQRPGVDLVSCLSCRHRSGNWCGPLAHPHVPLELKHRCKHHEPHRRSAR